MGRDIRVVVPNEFDFLRPTSTNTPLPATGLDKLIQIVTMELLSSPGRDIFNLPGGAGLREILPVGANKRTESGVLADLSIAIMRISDGIKARQNEEESDPKARLANLDLISVEFDIQNTKWEVVVELNSEFGQQALVPLAV